MAEGILGTHKSTGAGTFQVYTVPANKYVKANISVSVAGSANAQVKLYITSNTSPTDAEIIQVDKLKASNRGYDRSAVILKAGEKLFYTTDTSDTTVVIYGFEYDTAGSDVVTSQQGISAVGTYTFTPVGSAETATLNLTMSLVGNSGSDNIAADVYISKTDVASGHLLHKARLNMETLTGVERTGIVVSQSDKIIVVVTSLVGNAALRLHGFMRGVN